MCVCVLTPGLPDARRQAVGPDTQAGAAAGSFCIAKQTRAKTAGVAETRRARETGKPGPMSRHRGKAAWPHARRTAGPFSPATREAEQVRPLGISSEVQLIGEHVRADFDILSLKVNSAGQSLLSLRLRQSLLSGRCHHSEKGIDRREVAIFSGCLGQELLDSNSLFLISMKYGITTYRSPRNAQSSSADGCVSAAHAPLPR